MFAKELIQSKIKNSFKNATGKELDFSKLKIYSRVLIQNITALVEAFPNAAFQPLKTASDRKTFGFAHITVKTYSDDYFEAPTGYYVTTSLEIAHPTMQETVYTVKLRDELIDEWRHGYIPGIIVFHSTLDGIPFYKVIKPEEVKEMVAKYKPEVDSERDKRGYRWANLKCKNTEHKPIPDFIDETKTPFNFDYTPTFMRIANVQYAKFRNTGKPYVVTGYFGTLATDSFTFRSSREAAAALQKIGVKVSYRTLIRYMKSGKPIKLENNSQYDYIVISDEPGEDLEETLVENVKVFNPFSGENDTVKVKNVDTTVSEDIDISDIADGIIELDTDEVCTSDSPLQEVIIEKTWDYPTIYEQPPKKESEEDIIRHKWFEYRKNNPGSSYEQFMRQYF